MFSLMIIIMLNKMDMVEGYSTKSELRPGFGKGYEYMGKILPNTDTYWLVTGINLPRFDFNKPPFNSETGIPCSIFYENGKELTFRICREMDEIVQDFVQKEKAARKILNRMTEVDIPALLPMNDNLFGEEPRVGQVLGDAEMKFKLHDKFFDETILTDDILEDDENTDEFEIPERVAILLEQNNVSLPENHYLDEWESDSVTRSPGDHEPALTEPIPAPETEVPGEGMRGPERVPVWISDPEEPKPEATELPIGVDEIQVNKLEVQNINGKTTVTYTDKDENEWHYDGTTGSGMDKDIKTMLDSLDPPLKESDLPISMVITHPATPPTPKRRPPIRRP